MACEVTFLLPFLILFNSLSGDLLIAISNSLAIAVRDALQICLSYDIPIAMPNALLITVSDLLPTKCHTQTK